MQAVRFTYRSSDVTTSLYALLYFHMNGVYVYEKFFDYNKLFQMRMLNVLSESGDNISQVTYDKYDAEIYFIGTEDDFAEVQRNNSTNRIVVVYGEWVGRHSDELSKYSHIVCEGTDKKQLGNMLHSLIDSISDKGLLTGEAYKVMHITADIYNKYAVNELLLTSKYFYKTEDELAYKKIAGSYKRLYDKLVESLNEIGHTWGNTESINLQYAILSTAYEGTMYTYRCKRSFMYNPSSIINICKLLLENKNISIEYGKIINMLMAHVYGWLVLDDSEASSHYDNAVSEYNSYAYYRKGMIIVDVSDNYKKAFNYFKKAVEVYPNFVRAWYMIALCFREFKQWDKAAKTYDNINAILSSRVDACNLRAMEVENLFKANCLRGDINWFKLYKKESALSDYLRAEKIWEGIEGLKFYQEIGICDEESKAMLSRVKREQEIQRAYSRLGDLYESIGKDDKARKYYNKIL